MLPGLRGRRGARPVRRPHPVEPATIFDDKRAYLEAYQARKRPVIEAERAAWKGPRVDLLAELPAWWDPLLEQADMICAGVDQPVLLDVGDERVVIDFVERVSGVRSRTRTRATSSSSSASSSTTSSASTSRTG